MYSEGNIYFWNFLKYFINIHTIFKLLTRYNIRCEVNILKLSLIIQMHAQNVWYVNDWVFP